MIMGRHIVNKQSVVNFTIVLIFASALILGSTNLGRDFGAFGAKAESPVKAPPAFKPVGNYKFMSEQDFSAVKISSTEGVAGCKENRTGQIILVTNIDPRLNDLQTAFYNGSDFTKRGTLFDIDKSIKTSIIKNLSSSHDGKEELKKLYGTDDETEISKSLVSGALFQKVPLNQSYSGSIYSADWSDKSIMIPAQSGPKKACESIVVLINYDKSKDSLSESYQVCVHSKDRAKDYLEKKTFLYPDEKAAAQLYLKEQSDRLISLGPCQKAKESSAEVPKPAVVDDAIPPKSSVQIGRESDDKIGVAGDDNVIPSEKWRERAFAELNKIRQENGVSPLKRANDLDNFAAKSLAFVADGKHESDDEDSQEYAHKYAKLHGRESGVLGEIRNGNPHGSSATPEESMRGYQTSSLHWASILNPSYTEVGIARLIDNQNGLWNLVDFR